MANRRIIDIGVEGNDGTGDSLRESFRKTNENFEDLYAVFGEEGTIDFTLLADTPDTLVPNTVPFVNESGTQINLLELASNSALDENATDTITFDYSENGKLVISSGFTRISDDTKPALGGPLDASNFAIGRVEVSNQAAIDFNNRHNESISIDDLVISKGFADRRYISTGLPFRTASEPDTVSQYSFEIQEYVNGNLLIPSHGIDRAANGSAYTFQSKFDDPNRLTSGETYYIRYVSQDEIAVFDTKDIAELIDDGTALTQKVSVSGTIASDDVHKIVDAGYDPELYGNYLSDVALPRESVVRRQGDDMEGKLYLSDHPGDLAGFGTVNGADDLQAATKLYVDNTSFSSTENIFVSTSGDDRMVGVPKGREGTAFDFAYRTISAAAGKAEEMIRAAQPEPGPYMQTVTANNGDDVAEIVSAGIVTPENPQARRLVDLNKDFLLQEYIGFIESKFPNFIFDEEDWRSDAERIIDAVRFDINRGINANTLTRQSAEQFYGSVSGRFKISNELEQLTAGIDYLKEALDAVFDNRLYREKEVDSISVDGIRARVTTIQNHGLSNGDQVVFQNMGGMVEIENQTAYARVLSDNEFELYTDPELNELFDISSYTNYTTDGVIGVVHQERINSFNSVKLLPVYDNPDADDSAQSAVRNKIDLIKNIITNGIDAGADINYGNNYKIVLDNKSQSYVDQANPDKLDMVPGKIIVGKTSGAKGRIVKVTNNDGTENDQDSFELLQVNGVDFEVGEEVKFGNFVKKKQITIFVESGIYQEDLPIKVSDNVSIKGDEFRRVIIRPKQRVSQSKWANTYFYRDIEFDDNILLARQHARIESVGDTSSSSIVLDTVDWLSVGDVVKFDGKVSRVSEIDTDSVYTIDTLDSSTNSISLKDDSGTTLDFSAQNLSSNLNAVYLVQSRVAAFLNQTNQIQGYVGRHYLEDPYAERDIGVVPNNPGQYETASRILVRNRRYIVEEIIAYINDNINTADNAGDTSSIWYDFQYSANDYRETFGNIIDAITHDVLRGGSEKALEEQGNLYYYTSASEQAQVKDAVERINFYTAQLLEGNTPQVSTDVEPDTSLGSAETDSVALVGNFVSLVVFAFDDDYNPPKRNNSDGVDVFLMGDATILRNCTVQNQAGFMCVLDPQSQILTKSPYIQTGSSFNKSDNEKRFRGGMYVDAFTGNISAKIRTVVNPFELEVDSEVGQGLFQRAPLLPAPFYLDGIRYQINAISNYDSGQGTVKLFLDKNSNKNSSGEGQGYQGSVDQPIFIQTAGNRSMLGNDFTQINDYGYGLVTNNGAFSEMVSMFTYFCQAAYYAKNGSEIRSLNGSNGYGRFGLVAEGADPNEIPDQVVLRDPLNVPCKAYTTAVYTNAIEQPFVTVYDLAVAPQRNSIITIDHGDAIGVLEYRISTVDDLTAKDGVTAASYEVSNRVYELALQADEAQAGNFYGELQETVSADTYLEYRFSENLVFDNVRNTKQVVDRSSTAINFDESDSVTYRTLSFATTDPFENDLPDNQVLTQTEVPFDFVQLEVDLENLGSGNGSAPSDTRIAVEQIASQDTIKRLLRDIDGKQPGDTGYSGGMIFAYAGKTHRITNYVDDTNFSYIEFEDVAGTDVNAGVNVTGLNEGIPASRSRTLFAGIDKNATAEITIAISLLRASGHDFTQIGAGGFNDANYPNVIYGPPENSLAEPYTDAPTASSGQVWERRKGRVFFVTTDQDGFFRVGKFFSVDQATGSIEFSGSVGLSNANALGFTRGVTINEFSADDSFSDLSSQAVPTEKTTASYINRILGYNVQSTSQIDPPPTGNRIGPGFLPLNGENSMESDLNVGDNKIINIDLPGTDGTAATNKNYVDDINKAYDQLEDLRNTYLDTVANNDILVGTGLKRLFVTPVTNGTIEPGDVIESASEAKTGTVVDFEVISDFVEDTLNVIVYEPTAGEFNIGETVYKQNDTAQATVVDGPIDELANAREDTNSVINLSVTRDADNITYDLQIQDDSVVNADVNSSAEIAQSKLNMQTADLFDEDSATSGWNGSNSKAQSDLGLAKFSDENFDTKQGYVRLTANGVVFAEMQQVDQYQAFARTASGTGDISAIDFSDIIEYGKGLEDKDFTNEVVSTDTGFPGSVLVKLSSETYGTTDISTSASADSIARRTNTGALDGNVIKVNGFDTLSVSSTTLRIDTPGGARILTASGNTTGSLVSVIPGNLDVGETARTSESNFQGGSSFAGEGWLASDWMYTSFIEANTEGGSNSTGIGIGANTGFASSAGDVITLVAQGSERLVVDSSNTTVKDSLKVDNALTVDGLTTLKGNTDIGNASSDSVSINARIDTNVLPDQNETRNIGSSGTRWDTVYANIFDGTATEAKYADLAEKYTADADYEPGTVVVFGGAHEVSTTNSKGDHRVAGVVSSNPGFLMNNELESNKESYAVEVGLTGRLPCKVLGKINKGDMLVSSPIPGYAVVNNNPGVGTVLGKSLQDKTDGNKGVIEIVVGRT